MRRVRDVRYRRGAFSEARARVEAASVWSALLEDGASERTILDRFVFEGLPAKAVAAEMNVSLRQFYRLYARLLGLLDAGANRRPAAAVPLAPKVESELEHARTLLLHGRSEDARCSLARTLASNLEPRQAIAAMLLESRALADRTLFAEAERSIEAAIRVAGEVHPGRRQRTVCDIAMAQSYVAYAGGYYGSALVRAEEAFERRRGDDRACTPPETRSLARDRIYLGILHQEGGESRRAVEHFETALQLLVSLPVAPGAELAQASIQLAITQTALATDVTRAIEHADEALRIAQWHGLRHEEVWAHLALGNLQLMTGARGDALRSGESALAIARATLKGDPMARTLFVNTRLQTSIGSADRGLEHVEEARPHVEPASILGGILEICEARAHHAAGHDDETIEAAGRAIATMESRFPTHYVGMAYWARGSVRARRGLAGDAEDAERAVYYLGRGSPLPDYACALELSAAVTKNARHAQMAREVRATLHG